MTLSHFKRSVFVAALAAQAPASAIDFEHGELKASLENRVTVGASWRVADRDPALIGIANGGRSFSTNNDDGNLAWGQGEMVDSTFRVTSDLALDYGDFGLFARGVAGYNPTLNDAALFDPADYGGTRVFPQAERERKERDVQRHNGRYLDLRDLYLHTNQEVLGRSVSVRVGRQVVNWGESTFVLHGLNSLLTLDANRARLPGFELDEVIVPNSQIWVSAALFGSFNLEAFYQLEWQRTEIDASGSYFSTNDFAAIGGTAANLGFGRADENVPAGTPCFAPPVAGNQCVPVGSVIPRAPDVNPDNEGQFGAALRFSIPVLNDMDAALYAANYHSRLPLFSGTSRIAAGLTPATTANYFVEYPKDIRIYGLSFNTTIPFDFSIQGEYSYKQGQPIQIDDIELLLAGLGAASQLNRTPGATLGGQYLRGYRRKDVSQADIGLTRLFGPSSWMGSEQTLFVAEAAVTHVHGLEDQSVLRYEGPGTFTPGDAATAASQGVPQQVEGYATATSYGYKLVLRNDYNNVFNLINVRPTLRWDHDLRGTAPTPVTNFIEGRRQLTAGVGFTYLGNVSGDVSYTRFIGSVKQNLLADRDFIEMNWKYSF
jgi:hypothetical protein